MSSANLALENQLPESREARLQRINAILVAEGLSPLKRLGIFDRGRGGEWELIDHIGIFKIFHALKVGIYLVRHPLTGTYTKHVIMHNLWPGHTVLVVVNGDMVVSLQTNRFALKSVVLELARAWKDVGVGLSRGATSKAIVARKLPELLEVADIEMALDMTEPLMENSGISDQTMTYHVIFLTSDTTSSLDLQRQLRKLRTDKVSTVFVKTIEQMTEMMETHVKIPGRIVSGKTKNKGFRDVFSLGTWLVFLKYFLEPYQKGEISSNKIA